MLSFQISHLPSRLKHMAAVGGLESEKGQLSSRARTPCLDLLIARAASQAHLKRQRGELVLSFQMSQYSCTYNCNTTGHTVHTAGHTGHTVLHTVHTVLHTVLHTAGIQLEYSWNTVRTIFTYISHTLHTVSPLDLLRRLGTMGEVVPVSALSSASTCGSHCQAVCLACSCSAHTCMAEIHVPQHPRNDAGAARPDLGHLEHPRNGAGAVHLGWHPLPPTE